MITVEPPEVDHATTYVLDEQIGFLLRQVTQRHTTIFAHLIGDDLTPMQWAVLAKLHEIGQTSQAALGRAVCMDAATVKGTVDRLMTRGLAVRSQDLDDRRKLLVDLTEEGLAVALRNRERAIAITRETLAPLTDKETRLLFALLTKMK